MHRSVLSLSDLIDDLNNNVIKKEQLTFEEKLAIYLSDNEQKVAQCLAYISLCQRLDIHTYRRFHNLSKTRFYTLLSKGILKRNEDGTIPLFPAPPPSRVYSKGEL